MTSSADPGVPNPCGCGFCNCCGLVGEAPPPGGRTEPKAAPPASPTPPARKPAKKPSAPNLLSLLDLIDPSEDMARGNYLQDPD